MAEHMIECMAGAWIEVPDEWGWGATRILRTELQQELGYWTEEWRGVYGVMIWVTGDRIELDREPPDHCPDAW
jgi:hypothetical protein